MTFGPIWLLSPPGNTLITIKAPLREWARRVGHLPSKLKIAGSNPAGVAITKKLLLSGQLLASHFAHPGRLVGQILFALCP
jgi:hypothetical protein